MQTLSNVVSNLIEEQRLLLHHHECQAAQCQLKGHENRTAEILNNRREAESGIPGIEAIERMEQI